MKKVEVGTQWRMKCFQPPCEIINWVPKTFFADNFSTKSHLLDGMLRFFEACSAIGDIFVETSGILTVFTIG